MLREIVAHARARPAPPSAATHAPEEPALRPRGALRHRSRPTGASRTTCARSSRASSTARASHEFKARYGDDARDAASRTSAGYPVGIVANNGILFSRVGAQGDALHRAGLPARASRSSSCRTSPASWSARSTSTAASRRTAPRWCTPSPTRRCRSSRSSSAARSAPATTACAAAPTSRACSGCGPTRASRVMGGEQAAETVLTVRARPAARARRATHGRGRARGVRAADPRQVRARERSPYYSTARLWDDGILDPLDTRARARARSRRRRARPDRPSRASASSGCERPRHVERDGAIARIWLDRPERRNAFNDELIAALTATFAALAADEALRAVVIAGRGPDVLRRAATSTGCAPRGELPLRGQPRRRRARRGDVRGGRQLSGAGDRARARRGARRRRGPRLLLRHRPRPRTRASASRR